MQLGALEKQVLHYLWQYKSADAKQTWWYVEYNPEYVRPFV
ncbi:hypothetical protein [Parashewanella hymeniacidonis]